MLTLSFNRYLLIIIVYCGYLTFLTSAEMRTDVPKSEAEWQNTEAPVDDPIGLGERLALIDYFQEEQQKLEAGMTLSDLRIKYWASHAAENKRLALYLELRDVYKVSRISENMSYEALVSIKKSALRKKAVAQDIEMTAPPGAGINNGNDRGDKGQGDVASERLASQPQNAADSKTPAGQPAMWPPVSGKHMPNMTLTDLHGRSVTLSSVSGGKPMLLEYVGMTCGGCNAFLGGNKKEIGAFAGQYAQKGLQSVAEYMPVYGKGIEISDPGFVYVVVLFYGLDGSSAPSLKDAQSYAKHYKLTAHRNHVVLFGDSSFINRKTHNMIPGFQLVDKKNMVISDSVGHKPKDNFYTHTLPALSKLVKGR